MHEGSCCSCSLENSVVTRDRKDILSSLYTDMNQRKFDSLASKFARNFVFYEGENKLSGIDRSAKAALKSCSFQDIKQIRGQPDRHPTLYTKLENQT